MSPGRQLAITLAAALGILFVVSATVIGTWLERIPVVGPSIPFFVLTVAVLVWRIRAGDGRASFGLTRPASWVRTLVVTALAVAVRLGLSAVLGPLVERAGATPDLARLDPVRSDPSMLWWLLPAIWLVAALGEEVLHRGFVMTRLARMWGGDRGAWVRAVVVSAVLFGLGHAYQGWAGALLATMSAAIFGCAFLLGGRNLWAAVMAHGVGNTVVLVLR